MKGIMDRTTEMRKDFTTGGTTDLMMEGIRDLTKETTTRVTTTDLNITNREEDLRDIRTTANLILVRETTATATEGSHRQKTRCWTN